MVRQPDSRRATSRRRLHRFSDCDLRCRKGDQIGNSYALGVLDLMEMTECVAHLAIMCVDAYRKDVFPTLYRADVVLAS
jgi:hypothetical protein